MDTANWITIVTALVGAAVGYGASQARITAQGIRLAELASALKESEAAREREIAELRASSASSSERQGQRLGRLEAWRKAVEAVDAERIRTRTGAVPIGPLDADDSKEQT